MACVEITSDYFSSFGTPGVYNKAVGAGGAVTWRSKAGNPFMTSHWLATGNYLAISGEVSGESGGFMRDQSRNIAVTLVINHLYGLVLLPVWSERYRFPTRHKNNHKAPIVVGVRDNI